MSLPMEGTEMELARLEEELDELLEEKRLNLARPMRGVVRDALQRQFERAEARLRGRIAALQGKGSEEAPADGMEE